VFFFAVDTRAGWKIKRRSTNEGATNNNTHITKKGERKNDNIILGGKIIVAIGFGILVLPPLMSSFLVCEPSLKFPV
jgi:hypothetical protein